ncbi:MAG: acetylxylan esterase [Acidimicrobiia bacterium]
MEAISVEAISVKAISAETTRAEAAVAGDASGRGVRQSERLLGLEGLSDRDPVGVLEVHQLVVAALDRDSDGFGRAHAALERLAASHPDTRPRCEYWRAVLADSQGNSHQVHEIAEHVRRRGEWWGEAVFRASPGLASSIGGAVMADFGDRWRQGGTLEILTPGGDGPFPTVVVLHGQGQGLRRLRSIWPASVPAGWAVVLVASSQHLWGEGMGCWNDRSVAVDEVRAHLAAIRADPRVDESRVVMAGFSQGAHVAAAVAVADAQVSALVAVSPLADFVAGLPARAVPTWVLLGRADVVSGSSPEPLAAQLAAVGLRATVEPHPLGHVYPADFPERLREALVRLV